MRTYTSPDEIDAQMKAEKERKKVDTRLYMINVYIYNKCTLIEMHTNTQSDVQREEEEGASNDNLAEEKLQGSGSEESDDEGSQVS